LHLAQRQGKQGLDRQLGIGDGSQDLGSEKKAGSSCLDGRGTAGGAGGGVGPQARAAEPPTTSRISWVMAA
jgi:hypothetical protein